MTTTKIRREFRSYEAAVDCANMLRNSNPGSEYKVRAAAGSSWGYKRMVVLQKIDGVWESFF